MPCRNEPMPEIERIHDHPSIKEHSLHVLDCRSFAEIVPAVSAMPCRHFVTLLVAHFTTITRDSLVALSQQMIDAGSRYFCAWGRDCRVAHHAFDLACCEFEPEGDHVILTTDHHDESLEQAIWFALNCARPDGPYERGCHATIAISVNDHEAGQTIRRAFADPVRFSEHNGPAE